MHALIEAEHLARYHWASTWGAGHRVLDAGCGVGYGSLLMHAAGARSVTGVDISRETIETANERATGGAQFVTGDISALPLEDASFDVAVCFETIEHVFDQNRALDELRRVLTQDGLLILSSPNREVYQEGNPYHTHEYTPDELQTALRDRFVNVKLKRQQAWLASMICDDDILLQADPNRVLDVGVYKVAAMHPGRETFTLAMASDAELPKPGALAMLTNLDELAAWRERARSAEEHLKRSHQAAVETETAYQSMSVSYASTRNDYEAACKDYENAVAALETSQRESSQRERSLHHASTLLAERNAALHLVADELAELHAQAAQLEARLDRVTASLAKLKTSFSWRITAPLRALSHARRGA
jgi:SAM-dependent methyltransferase